VIELVFIVSSDSNVAAVSVLLVESVKDADAETIKRCNRGGVAVVLSIVV
jgi:hypothetical protein